jgi:iron complex transport system substrate-binding protein
LIPLQKEWDQAKKQAAGLLAKWKGPKKKGLMIMSNTGDKVTVRGIGSCERRRQPMTTSPLS